MSSNYEAKNIMKLWLRMMLVLFAFFISPSRANIVFTAKIQPETIHVKEPVLLIIEWKNTSVKQEWAKFEKIKLKVKKDDNPAVEYDLFETYNSQFEDSAMGYAKLKPNETFRYERWLSLGTRDKFGNWEYLFDEKGKYSVDLVNHKHGDLKLEVLHNTNEVNVSAIHDFKTSAFMIFLHDYEFPGKEEGRKSLESVVSEHSESIYAPYAALALVNYNWEVKGGRLRNFNYCEKMLEFILTKHPLFPFRDKAYFFLSKILAHQEGQKHKISDVLKRLHKENPDSKYISEIETSFGVKMRHERPSGDVENMQIQNIDSRTLKIEDLSKIPEAVRDSFYSYYKAVFDNDLEVATHYIENSEFVGVHGGVDEWKSEWSQTFDNYIIVKLKIIVEESNMASSYMHQALRNNDGKRFNGDLCIIKSRANYRMFNKVTGEAVTANEALPEMVLKRYENGWRIISEYREPTLNQKAGYEANKFYMQLKEFSGKAKIHKKSSEVLVEKLILSEIGMIEEADVILSWRHLGITMEGDEYDKPKIHGVLQVSSGPSSKDEGAPDKEYKVAFKTVLGDLGLELVELIIDDI